MQGLGVLNKQVYNCQNCQLKPILVCVMQSRFVFCEKGTVDWWENMDNRFSILVAPLPDLCLCFFVFFVFCVCVLFVVIVLVGGKI